MTFDILFGKLPFKTSEIYRSQEPDQVRRCSVLYRRRNPQMPSLAPGKAITTQQLPHFWGFSSLLILALEQYTCS
jgi:hypothetical protein